MICPKCNRGEMQIGIGRGYLNKPILRYASTIVGIDKNKAWYECRYCSHKEVYPIQLGDKFIFKIFKIQQWFKNLL